MFSDEFFVDFYVFYWSEPKHSLPVMSNAGTEAGQSFTLSELRNATKNFENKVGSGGYGTVYYGKLNDGKEIAVKILENNNFYQGKKEFANEVTFWYSKFSVFFYMIQQALPDYFICVLFFF